MSGTEVLEALYDGFATGNVPQVLGTLADDVEWTESAGFIYGGTFVGPDAVAAGLFAKLGSEWDNFAAEPDLIIEDGDQVVARGWYSGVYKATGKSFRARFVHWATVVDGKIVRYEQIADSAEVNKAL